MSKRSINIREYNNKQRLLFPPSVGDYLKEDDFAFVIDEVVDLIDLSPYYKKIPNVGNPSYDPAMMLKIILYAYANKIFSSRKIEDKLSKDVAFIFLSGMQKPDHKTISEFRRKHSEEIGDSLKEVFKICVKLGIVHFGEVSIDSKVMKANASVEKSMNEERLLKEEEQIKKKIKEYLDKAREIDEEEDNKYGEDNRGDELPEGIRNREDRIRKIKEAKKRIDEEQKMLKKEIEKSIEQLMDKETKI